MEIKLKKMLIHIKLSAWLLILQFLNELTCSSFLLYKIMNRRTRMIKEESCLLLIIANEIINTSSNAKQLWDNAY
jgi:hypothetical protein